MSLHGKPKDPMAEAYAEFLSQSEGGIYVALSGIDLIKASRLLRLAKIEHEIKYGSLWDFLTFPVGSGIDHIFLIQMHRNYIGNKVHIIHPNGVSGIDQIWLDSSNELKKMLKTLNVEASVTGRAYKMSNASLQLVKRINSKQRPKLNGIVFSINTDIPLELINTHGIWFKSSNEKACNESF